LENLTRPDAVMRLVVVPKPDHSSRP
jgi:hypothetical protein